MENPEDWVIMGNFFIMNYSPKINDLSMLLLREYYVNPKIPKFYCEVIETWKTLNFERNESLSFDAFLEKYIWYDKTFITTTAQDVDLMQAGIYQVKDLWDQKEMRVIDERELVEKFCPRFNFDKVNRVLNRFREITPKIVELSEKLAITPSSRNVRIEDYFIFDRVSMKVKDLYWRYRKNTIYVDYKARVHLGFVISDEFFKGFYKTLKDSDLPNKTKALLWLLSWEGLLVANITKDWFPDEDGQCKICKNEAETQFHLFNECRVVYLFLIWLGHVLDIDVTWSEKLVLFNNYGNPPDKFDFYCLGIAKQVIWGVRNKILFEGATFNLLGVVMMFKNTLKSELTILHLLDKKKGRVDDFVKLYTGRRITLQNAKIILHF